MMRQYGTTLFPVEFDKQKIAVRTFVVRAIEAALRAVVVAGSPCTTFPLLCRSVSYLTIACTMKTAVLASLIAGAAAFAPAQQKASSSALSMAFENELGAQPPVCSM